MSLRNINDLAEGNERFVAFVGAGASSLPPSSLPTWTEFNDLVLESLCERLAQFADNRQPTQQMLAAFRRRRDETRFLAPDFQAQLMEEEVGRDYFRVWQSLDTDAYGPVHSALAELAARGRLAAIVTTNFDTLIEQAFQDRDEPFDVFHDVATFEDLKTIGGRERSSAVPMIKIHGSIEDPASLIDTLKQRLAGRPETLDRALQLLLQRYPWLFLGFSGADFSYDPHYLGILDAADSAQGFVFLARKVEAVRDGVRSLVEAYGAQKATIAYGELGTWLGETFGLDATLGHPPVGADTNDNVARVKQAIGRWVDGLGPMAVVNILCSMLRSAGMEHEAHWLLRRTWKSYRSAQDTKGRSYARYNYNYGLSLLEAGCIRNPVSLAADQSNLLEWREHADQNAYEFFGRRYQSGNLLAAAGQLARVMAYRGDVGEAIELAADITDKALEGGATLEFCEISIASATIFDIVQSFGPAAEQLRRGLEIVERLGDEPRRAMLCAKLGRFLTYDGKFDEADGFIAKADHVGRRLDLRSVLLESQATRGLWLADSGNAPEQAVQLLVEVAAAIRAQDDVPIVTQTKPMQPESTPVEIKGQNPMLCRVLLDLARASWMAGDAPVLNKTLDELDELVTDVFRGYCPHYYLTYARCLMTDLDGGHEALIEDLIRRARALGKSDGNPWVATEADFLDRLSQQRQTSLR